jgi:hypothetical protein
MKIAYICYWDAFRLDGVTKKILTQTEYWRAEGHSVGIFCLSPMSDSSLEPVLGASVFPFSGPIQRLRATHKLARAVRSFQSDVIYLRYDLFLPPLWGVLRERPLVVELNEQPEEYALRRTAARSYDRFSRSRLLGRADGFVCVADELAKSRWLEEFARPAVVIGNSIDLGEFPVAAVPGNRRPRGVFLGAPGLPWHGVDKVRSLADRLPEMDFDVIGPTADDLGGTIPANLVSHGFLSRGEYEPLVLQADFAVGTLALHRQGIGETAPLKLREYLAYGLPMIVAHDDPDLTREPHWFVLRLPNRESNVEDCHQAVRSWVGSVVGRRIPRETAERLVSVQVKEPERLAFMEQMRDSFAAAGRGR